MRTSAWDITEIQASVEASLSAALEDLERLESAAPLRRRLPPPLPAAHVATPPRPLRAFPPPLPSS
jgi:hypothetical protein